MWEELCEGLIPCAPAGSKGLSTTWSMDLGDGCTRKTRVGRCKLEAGEGLHSEGESHQGNATSPVPGFCSFQSLCFFSF